MGVDVTDYGAVGDGVTPSDPAFAAAGAALVSLGGGKLHVPAGDFLLEDNIGLNTVGGIHICGEGRGVTTLVGAPGLADHVVAVHSSTSCSISDLDIDASGQVAGHGVRVAFVDDFALRRVGIHHAWTYGFGAQDGYIKRLTIEDVLVVDAGADGVDLKNKANANEGIFISNLRVDGFGRRGGEKKAGVDLRGPVMAFGIEVRNVPHLGYGIRLRQGEDTSSNGIGGHKSSLIGFQVFGGGVNGWGVNALVRHARLSGGYVEGLEQAGIALGGAGHEETIATGNTIVDCGRGFLIGGDRCMVRNNLIKQCAIPVEDNGTGNDVGDNLIVS